MICSNLSIQIHVRSQKNLTSKTPQFPTLILRERERERGDKDNSTRLGQKPKH